MSGVQIEHRSYEMPPREGISMMGDRRVATFFYGSFMDDNILKQLGVVAERSEVAVFVLSRHTV